MKRLEQSFLDYIFPDATPKEIGTYLGAANRQMIDAVADVEDDISCSLADEARLRKLIEHPDVHVRKAAFDVFLHWVTPTWEELERWTLDPDGDVRDQVFVGMEWGAFRDLFMEDKRRVVALYVASAWEFSNLDVTAGSLASEEEWWKLFWPEIGKMLDEGNDELRQNVEVGFIEDVLMHHDPGPDHALIAEWLRGKSKKRKQAFIAYLGWTSNRPLGLRAIEQALMKNADPEIACEAKAIHDWMHRTHD
jgi:hypothetical protein